MKAKLFRFRRSSAISLWMLSVGLLAVSCLGLLGVVVRLASLTLGFASLAIAAGILIATHAAFLLIALAIEILDQDNERPSLDPPDRDRD